MKAIAFLLVCGGCASVGPKQAVRAASPECAGIAMLAGGAKPERPYRVVGTIEDHDASPAERYRSLQAQACELRAQAVIGVNDRLLPNGNNFGSVESNQVFAGEDTGRVSTSGSAIVFIDGLPPPRPANPQYVFPRVEGRR